MSLWWLTAAAAFSLFLILTFRVSRNEWLHWKTVTVMFVSCRPVEIHLGVTEDPTTMRLTWRTDRKGCSSTVFYRRELGGSKQQAHGFEYEGDSALLCGGTASTYSFRLHLHTALLKDLLPDERYVYTLHSDMAHPLIFRSRKAAATPFEFYAFADSGTGVGARLVWEAMQREIEGNGVPDFFLDVGDLANADGVPSVWDAFMRQIEPFSARAPWVVGVGNHEYDIRSDLPDPWGITPYHPPWGNFHAGTSDGECGLPAYWRFPTGNALSPESFRPEGENGTLPQPLDGDPFAPFYFAFRHGAVHVIVISTEHSLEKGSTQRRWLEKTLESVDRCRTPFVVVGGHRPFASPRSSTANYLCGIGLRDRFEELLIRHRVDVYVSGHVHYYYRLCESRQGKCVPPGNGLISIVIGSAGHKLATLYPGDFDYNDMVIFEGFGFGKFRVKGTESMEFVFMEAQNRTVFDRHVFLNQRLCRNFE